MPGIDEWAERKGCSYVTLLVNAETGHTVDILEDCLGQTVTTWPRRHPEIQVICRDRAGVLAEFPGATPPATQITDRWHLWHNLCRAADGVIRAHRHDLRESESSEPSARPCHTQTLDTTAEPAPPAASATVIRDETDSVTATRTRERHKAAHALLTRGLTIIAISQHLGLATRPCANTATQPWPSSSSPVPATTAARSASSCPTCANGSRTTAWPTLPRCTANFTTVAVAAVAVTSNRSGKGQPFPLSCRWLLPAAMSPTGSPAIPAVSPRTVTPGSGQSWSAAQARPGWRRTLSSFAGMMMNRTGVTGPKSWLVTVLADDIPQLHSSARGIERDLDAVTNGLTLLHFSGTVEGNVTRIKASNAALTDA